jgi:hypothetical protein
MGTAVHICACGNHAWFALSRGYCGMVDADTAAVAAAFTWHAKIDKRTGRVCVRRIVHARIGGVRKTFGQFLHNLICPLPEPYRPDHANRNALDNRRENLRAATATTNSINRISRNQKAGLYRGVTEIRGKYRALITSSGKQLTLGYFDNPKDAALAYDVAAKTYHGQFAVLNFSEGLQ